MASGPARNLASLCYQVVWTEEDLVIVVICSLLSGEIDAGPRRTIGRTPGELVCVLRIGESLK